MADTLFDKDFLKRIEYLNLIARRLVFGRQQAQHQSVRKGASIEFRDFREYSPGDDPRTVDWTVYARLGELVIKLFRQEEELDLWVLLDRSGSMNFGDPNKFDHARRIAAALAYIGMSNMDSASIVPFTNKLEPGRTQLRGRGRIFNVFEFLDDLKTGGVTDPAASLQEFVSRVRRPGLIVLLSDFYGLERVRAGLDRLRFFKHQIYVMQVASPWEINPTIRGELRLVDCETQDFDDLTITDSMLRRYKKAFADFSEDIKRYGMKYAIGYALARTDTPFDAFLRTVLERGGLVA
ncbi:MAG TPA: DUF58 domain-containing protein [Phycisphaerae bacterium]|nr:DUF58 domain-containing protein [Phycisphaerae bacterium]HRW52998.1 DUF58 domain-containing protein [Phycisphaerae bacterium]